MALLLSHIFELHEDVLFYLLEEWFDLRDIVSLDLSLCRHEYREQFFRLLHNDRKRHVSLSIGDVRIGYERLEDIGRWLKSRNIRLCNLHFSSYLLRNSFDVCMKFLENTTLKNLDVVLNSYQFSSVYGTVEIIEKAVNNDIETIAAACLSVLKCKKRKKRVNKSEQTLSNSGTSTSVSPSPLKHLSIRFLSCLHWFEAKIAIWPQSLQCFQSFSNLVSLKLEFIMLSSEMCALLPLQWPHLQHLCLDKIVFDSSDCWCSLLLHRQWVELRELRIVESKRANTEASEWSALIRQFRDATASQQAALPNLATLQVNASCVCLLAGLNSSNSLQSVELIFGDGWFETGSVSLFEHRDDGLLRNVKSLSVTFPTLSVRSIEECVHVMEVFVPRVDEVTFRCEVIATPAIVEYVSHALRVVLSSSSTVNAERLNIRIQVVNEQLGWFPFEQMEALSVQRCLQKTTNQSLCPRLSTLAVSWEEEATSYAETLTNATSGLLSLLFNDTQQPLSLNPLLHLFVDTKQSSSAGSTCPDDSDDHFRRVGFNTEDVSLLMDTVRSIPALSHLKRFHCTSPVTYNNSIVSHAMRDTHCVSASPVASFLLSLLQALPRSLTSFTFWVDPDSQMTLWHRLHHQPQQGQSGCRSSPSTVPETHEYVSLWQTLSVMEKLTCIYEIQRSKCCGDVQAAYETMWMETLVGLMEQLVLLVLTSSRSDTCHRFKRLHLKVLVHARNEVRSSAEQTANRIVALRQSCIDQVVSVGRDSVQNDNRDRCDGTETAERTVLNRMFTMEVQLKS